jgi:hypothetical protein
VPQLVTVRTLRAVYDALRAFQPFARWKLPAGSEVRFQTEISDKDDGAYCFDGTRHRIAINPRNHFSLNDIAETMAHEMVHMRQQLTGRLPEVRAEPHNKEFHRLKRLVCRDLGFNGKRF